MYFASFIAIFGIIGVIYGIVTSSVPDTLVVRDVPRTTKPKVEFPAFDSIKECPKCGASGHQIRNPQFDGQTLWYVCLVCCAGWRTHTKDYKPEPKKPETPEEAGRREVEEIAPNTP